jgi:hypothetical protein
MARAENIASGIMLLGFVLVGAGFWLGERNPGLAVTLWGLGGLIAALGFAMLLVIGAMSLGRRVLRATGTLPTPIEPADPKPGWPGWRFAVSGVMHEVWVDDTGGTPRVVCDGSWADTTHSGHTTMFRIEQRPATITGRVDWGGTVAMAPLVVGAALLGGGHGGAEPPPMRYDLQVDGIPVPERARLAYGRVPPPSSRTSPEAAVTARRDAGNSTPGDRPVPPGRHLRLDPPPR